MRSRNGLVINTIIFRSTLTNTLWKPFSFIIIPTTNTPARNPRVGSMQYESIDRELLGSKQQRAETSSGPKYRKESDGTIGLGGCFTG